MLPTLALAQQAGGHITRPGKAKPKTEKPATTKKQTTGKPSKKQSGSSQSTTTVGTGRALSAQPSKPSVSSFTDDNGNKVFIIGDVRFTMIKIDGGNFTMGATKEQGYDAGFYEQPAHTVSLSSYYIAQTEVTQELWKIIMDNNPSFKIDLKCPVYNISYDECVVFINRLSALTGEYFKLPTEAQWEFAARGGNKSKGYKYSGSNSIEDVACYFTGGYSEPLSVATKRPNELGIYDMTGNVSEWCYDYWGIYDASTQINPTGPSSGTHRVARGGSWLSPKDECCVSKRMIASKTDSELTAGLRLAM